MRSACLALLLAASSGLAFAQAPGGPAPGPSPAPTPAPSAPAAAPAAPAAGQAASPAPARPAQPTTPEGLVSSTMGEDIATASYYELVAWCRNLGLDDSGSRKDLQNRLADHYKVKLPLEAVKGKRVVTVKSARESLYYTLSDVNEKYVVLRGGVDIEVRDEGKGSVQEITADSITYNQTRHTISADGNVSYTMSKGKESQNYTGTRFSFDLDSSEGVFYDGATTKEVTQADQKLTYYFEGTTISRLSNNTVILQDGSFTTSVPVDPYWQLRAKTVWILAPSEWAVESAVLMVGRVPMMYFPAFFWPGDELFFNPNPGYDNRTGAFVQTTTYLLGRKTKQDNPFSFLQISETGETAYREELHGLFLRKIPGESPPPDNGQNLKLLLDVYSRLGVFAGMTGDFPPLGNFRLGLGFSRSIFLDQTLTYYTSYYYPTGSVYWNTSSFFGTPLPFRFGLDGSVQSSADPYSMSWKFAYYSDPTFISDFYTRSEGLNFSAVLQPTTNPVQTAATALQPNLSWDYVSKLDLTKVVKASPYIQSVSFPTLNMNMTWQSKDIPGASDPSSALYADPGHTFYYPSSITFPNVAFSVSGQILKLGTGTAAPPTPGAQSQAPGAPAPQTTPAVPGATTQPGAPAQQGTQAPQGTSAQPPASSQQPAQQPSGAPAAPGSATPPISETQSQAPGQQSVQQPAPGPTPPPAPSAPASAEPVVKDPGKGIRTPLFQKPPAPEAKKAVPSLYHEPAMWPDANAAAPGLGSSLDVTYQLQPRATLQSQFDNTYWTSPQAIDYSIQYMTVDTGGSGQVTAAASLWDRLVDMSTSLNLDGEFRQHFNPDQNQLNSTGTVLPTWQSLLLGDLLQDRLTLQGVFQSTLRPLLGVSNFTGSTLSYRLGMKVYQYAYNGTEFGTTGLTWTPDAISDNSVASTLLYQAGTFTNTLGLTLQVLPQSSLYTALEQAGTPDISGRVQAQGSTPLTPAAAQPFVLTSVLDVGPAVEVSQAFQFDSAVSVIQTSTSQARLWWLTGSYVAQQVNGLLAPATLNLGLNTGSNPLWFWKDRVKVDASVQSSYTMNLQTPTINELDFTFNLNFSIYRFLDLTFSSVSYNNQTNLYFAPYYMDPLSDLLKSFNFFNIQDRYASNFKIRSISVKLVHHLRDWDISLQYSGSPQLNTTTNAIQWSPTFTLQVKWLAVPFLQSTVQGDYTGITTLN